VEEETPEELVDNLTKAVGTGLTHIG